MTAIPLSQLIANDRMSVLRDAIVAGLAARLGGVSVKGHPGKLDIYDVVKGDIVQAPGVAVGWSRLQGARQIDMSYVSRVDWTAYIVVEDYADTGTRRRTDRDVVGHAIGGEILRMLHDPAVADWGLAGVTLPDGDPAPQMKPMFTAQAYERGTAYYAVTWTQTLVDQGLDPFAGATPTVVLGSDEDPLNGLQFDGEEAIPPEIAAIIAESEGEA
ncbi:hypothetical protein [Breoghania sp.]|uniref:hypothetical protein n=1 Tax=Breoghania sp. TaxID=2065378 RepID=UPI0029C9FDEE|nr:hypothetical protein [Breoghania sp.]